MSLLEQNMGKITKGFMALMFSSFFLAIMCWAWAEFCIKDTLMNGGKGNVCEDPEQIKNLEYAKVSLFTIVGICAFILVLKPLMSLMPFKGAREGFMPSGYGRRVML